MGVLTEICVDGDWRIWRERSESAYRKSVDARGVIFRIKTQLAFYAFRSLAWAITALAIAMTKNRSAASRKFRYVAQTLPVEADCNT